MEVGEDALNPLRVVQPPLDPVSTCHQRYTPCRAGTNSGRPQMTSKTPLTGCQVKPPDSCTPMKLTVVRPWSWQCSDLMCCHSVVLTISLSVGFLDSLHDPSAYVAPHDIPDAAVPVNEHALTPGLGSNTYLYLQIQIQIQIRRICICICIWSTVFGVFDKYVFKYTFSWAVFYKHKFMENKLTWIFFINMLKSAILFQNKCRGLIVLIPIGGCVCALDLACQWVCDKPLA